jgi:hypothetical protein
VQKVLSCAPPFVRGYDLSGILAFFQAKVAVIGLKHADLKFHGLTNAVT